jgi:hypothetical protein
MSKEINLTQIANAVGVALGELKKAETTAGLLKDTMNKYIAQLHSAKAVVGTYKKDGTGCALATAFIDGCIEAGLKQSTAQQTYLSTFKDAVKTGKPVTDWNKQRAKGKGKKGNKASEPKSLANKLATCYRDEDFESFIEDLQTSYDNDEGSLIECIKSYLEAAGIELKNE